MRLALFITFFCITCFSFGQDSLQIDTSLKAQPATNVDSVSIDTASSILKDSIVKKKKPKKKIRKAKIKEEPDVSNVENTVNTDSSGNNNGYSIGIFIIAIIIVLAVYRLNFTSTDRHENSTSKEEGFISDYLSRMLLSRREYYRNVYLKSEAWKRKRYVVMKRDNWRCVYCGGKATEVHHTRYAKRNIGKEPIGWLVSICRTCHDSKH